MSTASFIGSSLLEPLTESSSKMISSYVVPPEMAQLTLSGGRTATSDCIYCRSAGEADVAAAVTPGCRRRGRLRAGEADVAAAVTSYGAVASRRTAAATRHPLVVASLDRKLVTGSGGGGVPAETGPRKPGPGGGGVAADSGPWPPAAAMTASDYVDSCGSSRTPSINDDLFLALPFRSTSAFCQR